MTLVVKSRFASEASLALRWRDTRQITCFFVSQKGGGLGVPTVVSETRLRRGRVEGRQPFSRSDHLRQHPS